MPTYDLRFGYPINEKNIKGEPLPTQKAFHKSKAKYRLLAGGFATGKTTSLALEVIKELLKYNKNYGVLGRKDLGELKSTTLKELLDLLPDELIKSHNKQDKVLTLHNGSELYYMNLDVSREAVEKIKSLNLGFVAIDQLEEINEDIFLAFQGRLRRHDASRNFFATCNPAGHDWLWRKWKKSPPTDQYKLFETTTLENIYLPKDYVEELLQYPPRWVKRYVYCSWEDFEGIVYNEFIESKHTIDPVDPQDLQAQTKFYIVMDYGFRNPTAILYAFTDYDGRTIVYDEYYKEEQLISKIARDVKSRQMSPMTTFLADPSIARRERDGYSVWDDFNNDNNIYWQKANNVVMQGINRVNELFMDDKLYITKNCVNLISEMGAYKWKPLKSGEEKNEPEEVIKKDDHACDALRYLVNEVYTPVRSVEPPQVRLREDLPENDPVLNNKVTETTF